MLISIEHGLVFLSMPKCASTSIEMALQNYMDIVVRGPAKHTNYRRYERFCRPFLDQFCKQQKLETVCLIREPLDWLKSWYRYRTRDELKYLAVAEESDKNAQDKLANSLDLPVGQGGLGEDKEVVAPELSPHANCTANLSFDDFVKGYLSGNRPAWAQVGSQYEFIRNHAGEIGVDRIFPYEKIDLLIEYLSEKIGMELSIGTYNKSPEMELTLGSDTKNRVVSYFWKDYGLYTKALSDVGG